MVSLKQRSKELTKGIQVAENSMENIAAQLNRMSKEEQRTSVHAEKLRTEYSKQHRALNMYKRQLTETDKEMRRFSGSTKYTVFSLDKINDVLGTVRRQLNIANMTFEKGEKSTKSYNNYLKQLDIVMDKHKRTIQSLEARYKMVSKQQGANSKSALELKEKILQEKQSLSVLENQYKQTTAESKRFAMEQSTMTKSMNQIREQIKSVTNALKISASNFKMSGQTAEAYKARISELNNGMKQQQLIVQNLSRQYEYAKNQYGSTSREAQELNLKLTEERVKLKSLSGQLKETTHEHNRLQMEQKQGISTMSEIRAKMQSFNDVLSLSRSNLSRAGESVRAYKSHLSTLNSGMTQQKTVLHELKTQYDFVARAQGKNSQEARELASAISQQKIKMNELESEIKQTSAEYKRLTVEQQRAQRLSVTAFGRGIQSVNKYNDSIRNATSTMHAMGSGAFIYMTLPVVAAMGGAIKSSIEWEQALAGVAKTTNLSGKELNKMGQEITDMSNTLPFAASEVAGVAEAAGQLGVKKKDITAFTKTMLDLGVATNLTSEEAATEFARFANAAKMPIKDVDRLGSAVTALGNSTATTEKEIVEMAQRLAGAGHQAGFSADQIVSITAAMSSLGIESESGGSAMTQIFNKMTRAVTDGGEVLESFARTSGVSAEQFAQTWENNPSKALSMFIKGLSNTEGGAKGVLKALDEVGIKGIREADVIRRLANNHKVLDEALKTGADGWKKNTALTDEASVRYETMGSKLKILKNTFVNFLRTIGDAFAPVITKLADAFTALFTHLQSTSSATKIAITVFALMTAAIPPLLIGAGLLGGAITNIAGAVKVLNGTKGGAAFFELFNGGIKSALPKIGQMITKIPLIGGAMGSLAGPIGIAIAAIVAIGTAFVIAYKKSETFRNIVHAIIDPVVAAFKNLWNVAKLVFNALKSLFSGNTLPAVDILSKFLPKETAVKIISVFMQMRDTVINAFREVGRFGTEIGKKLALFWKENGKDILAALDNIKNAIIFVFNGIKGFLWPIIQGLGRLFKTIFMGVIVPAVKIGMKAIWSVMKFLWPLIKTLIVDTWNNIKGIIKGALDVILGIVKIFSGIFTGNWQLIWSGIKQVASGALKFLWNLIQLWLIGKILKVAKFFGALLIGAIKNAFNTIRNVINTVLKFVWNIIKTIFSRILSFSKSIFNGLSKFIRYIFVSIRNSVTGTVKSLWYNIKKVWNLLNRGSRSIFQSLKNFLVRIWNNIKHNVSRIAYNLWSSVRRTFNHLLSGTRSIFNRVKSSMVNVWHSIRRSVTGIASKLWGSVRRIFNNMANGLKSIIGRIKSHITGMVKAIKKGLNGLIKGLNWVGSKLGLPAIPKLSTGTQKINRQITTTSDGRLKQGTMAIVGDKGPGNGKGKDGRRELIQYPNGKTALTPANDTTTWLPKGSRVISGGARQKMLATGTLPHFSVGTWLKNASGWVGNKVKGAGEWLTDRIGDVMDYMDNPTKLFNKLLSNLGINFESITRGMGIVGQITRAAFNKIKQGAIDWLKDGFDSLGGELVGGILDPDKINYHYGHTAAYTAATGRPFHEGVDFPFVYQTVRTPMGGRLTRMPFMDGGYGNYVKITSGAIDMLFAHLKNFSKSPPSGSTVKPGDVVGLTGNTGFSTGPHLHFEMRRNGRHFDPEPYLRKAKANGKLAVSGGKGGASGRWSGNIRQALKLAGLPTTGAYVSAWAKQIQTESGGNPRALGGTDGLADGAAKGLVQVKPGTFNAFKLPGHGNIWNGLDNLIAGMRYAKVRYGRSGMLGVIGHGHGYATGGLVHNGLYRLGEEGYPEWVIPTDPARASDAAKLLALASKDISKNKRPKNFSNSAIGSNSDTSKLESKLDVMIALLTKLVGSNEDIADKDYTPVIDNFSLADFINSTIDKRERTNARKNKFKSGGALI
ncbi:phage tail tape measure protein [Staphylococcus muscae]|nr:phage tail tape measure protein [Staphylococcus muscae]